jgi:hypothetical protein
VVLVCDYCNSELPAERLLAAAQREAEALADPLSRPTTRSGPDYHAPL